ncbi:bifunctional acetyl-CoA hydrolase/transferase family protein/GNAT family N-acetyltransferase [Desulfospira joergensenii]|uniref:bifunctional acetyl-CoA hydrolase/transferase family protein/GNAT family N-acetyltransferase n=1 Tax=Desulfospira joergensenii TaxID=53329 RepID=UPI0003B44019|nr:bifunctional acetyl-CoA hydrolase/transferase family protein/GNAT family N-acetyltransferase [Desulfospira joergensenii]
MPEFDLSNWEDSLVPPERVLNHIKPGMTVFLGSGPATPRTLMRTLLDVDSHNIRDLELVQLAVQGDTILSVDKLNAPNYRLKTFFSGFVAWGTIASGQVDLIPAYYSEIPKVIKSRKVDIDVAFIQITPPDDAGYCSLGGAVDVAREAMDQASLVVGEVNTELPFTYGDTFVSIEDFNLLVRSDRGPVTYALPEVPEEMNRVAANVASVIKNGDCINYSLGPLFEALVPHLSDKKDLGIHSLYFTDALAELVNSGAVTNKFKSPFRGKSLASYALGSKNLMKWLNRNPLVEFQGIDWVCNSRLIAQNPQFVAIYEVRKVDLLGGASFPLKGAVITGPGEGIDFYKGAEGSADGATIIGLPSRNEKGESNILLSVQNFANQLRLRESVHMIATEYGIANLKWRTLRERAQAIIDIAHPDDREALVEQAREKKLIYPNQIFISRAAHLYPSHLDYRKTFKGGEEVRFRAIKPSDEEAMRRFFYRCSKEMIYYRFFYSIKTMAHDKMQEYVNVDYSREVSIVGLSTEGDQDKIIAEARLIRDERSYYGEVAFLIDEAFQGKGLGSYMMDLLVGFARKKGLKGIMAEVMSDNQPMIKVFEKIGLPMEASLDAGVYHLKISFGDKA